MSTVESFADYNVALSDVPWPGPWRLHGRCLQAPTSLFFPARGEDATVAQELCAGCPVLDECRAYALSHPSLTGVWAGLTGRDRRRLRSSLPAAPEPEPMEPAAAPTPNPAGTRYKILEDLAAHPGRWARVAHYASSHSAAAIASQLRTGRIPAPPGRWQFEGRVNSGGSDLYARLEETAP